MLVNLLNRYKFHLSILLVVLVVVEIIAYAAFALVISKKERSFVYDDKDILRESITLQELQNFRERSYDETTGWLPVANDHGDLLPDGDDVYWSYTIDSKRARLNPYAADRVQISVYGDSFTFCEQVNDDQTWPYYLSQITKTRVENWGVGAYGTDQAFLRLKMNLPKYRTNIVILGVFTENINRLMNAYRPFYGNSLQSMRLGFKPMLHQRDGKLDWLGNPLVYQTNSLEDYNRAYEKARQVDYWYGLNQRKVVVRFPFTIAFLRSIYYYATVGPRPNLYKVDDAVAKLDHILEEFQELARQHDFIGVVLFIPTSNALEQQIDNETYDYREYFAHVLARNDLERLRVVNIIERPFNRAKFNVRPFKYHASAYGNRIIAEAVYEAIKDDL